eukprot:PhF_6_TR42683/c0_g1_i1/m.64378
MDDRKTDFTASAITTTEYNNFCRMFRAYDTDQSGCLNRTELSAVTRSLGLHLSEQELNVWIAKYGDAHNGHMKLDGFLKFMYECMKGHLEENVDRKRSVAAHVQHKLQTSRLIRDASWRWGLDVVVFIAVAYYVIEIPWRDVREDALSSSFDRIFVWECFLTVMLAIDHVLNFFTLFKDRDDREVESLKEIAKHYMSTVGCFDFLSTLPLDLILDVHTPEGLVLHHLRLLSVFRLLNMFTVSNRMDFNPENVIFQNRVVPVCKLLFGLVYVVHIFTVIWLGLNPEKRYIEAIYLVLYTLTTVGLGDVPVTTQSQQYYMCVLFVAGACVNGFVIAELARLLQKYSVRRDKREKLTDMAVILKAYNIPKDLQEEILSYHHHVMHSDLPRTFHDCLDDLPPVMQQHLTMYTRIEYVSKLPMLRKLGVQTCTAIARSLNQMIYCPCEFIICYGETSVQMHFLTHGFVDVLTSTGDHVTTLMKGSFFGERMLLQNQPALCSLVALTYCDTLVLSKDKFYAICYRYPEFFDAVKVNSEEHWQRQKKGVSCVLRRKSEDVEESSNNNADLDDGTDSVLKKEFTEDDICMLRCTTDLLQDDDLRSLTPPPTLAPARRMSPQNSGLPGESSTLTSTSGAPRAVVEAVRRFKAVVHAKNIMTSPSYASSPTHSRRVSKKSLWGIDVNNWVNDVCNTDEEDEITACLNLPA